MRLKSRFLLNSFWRQLLTHYKARTEALYESVEKSPIDVDASKTRGTFVAQSRWGMGWRFNRGSHSKGEPCACEPHHLSVSDKAMLQQLFAVPLEGGPARSQQSLYIHEASIRARWAR